MPTGVVPHPSALTGVMEAVTGLATMAAAALTPFLRARRSRWGTPARVAEAVHPGDELIPRPSWGWTHSVEVAAPPADVWPWIAQIGADRGGFYSYELLENLVGCRVRNADRVHPEWEVHEGDGVSLHPSAPPLDVVAAVPGSHLLAHAAPDEDARTAGRAWCEVTWLFALAPHGPGHCRLTSRYRCAHSADRRTRLAFGAALMEPIGFAMDRRMLLGIRRRAERRRGAS